MIHSSLQGQSFIQEPSQLRSFNTRGLGKQLIQRALRLSLGIPQDRMHSRTAAYYDHCPVSFELNIMLKRNKLSSKPRIIYPPLCISESALPRKSSPTAATIAIRSFHPCPLNLLLAPKNSLNVTLLPATWGILLHF